MKFLSFRRLIDRRRRKGIAVNYEPEFRGEAGGKGPNSGVDSAVVAGVVWKISERADFLRGDRQPLPDQAQKTRCSLNKGGKTKRG
jgi:hypothetical protein